MPTAPNSHGLLFGATPDGAQRLDLHPAFGGASKAISALSPGVYEGLRTFEREKFFGLRTHLARLQDSVDGFDQPLAYDEETLVAALVAACREATAEYDCDVRIRVDVAAEPATALGCDSNVLLATTPFHGLPESVRRDGALLRTAPGLARPVPSVKTSNFIPLREAWIDAHGDRNAYEHVMLDPVGGLLEGTQSNLVLIKDGACHAAHSGVLPGVTQRAVLDLARELGIPVHDVHVPRADLASYDEAFMTTSVRSVVPVSRLDDIAFPLPGEVTSRLSKAYDALTAADAVVPSNRANARY